MATADIESNLEQNATEETSPDFEPIPEKRKSRARPVSLTICTITAILVLAFCIFNRTVDVYRPDTTQKNTTNKCYIKEERLAFSSLLAIALGLFGVALGTLVDRLSLINEEWHHLHQRYRRSWTKMIKVCFSGISWSAVFALLGSTTIIAITLIFVRVYVTGKPWFDLGYIEYVFGGIGVGPLIMHLLNLNTQSEVYISTILEGKGMYVAHGLAWSYYFNYLKEALPEFKEARNSRFPAPHEHVRLTSNTLLLLMPHDCYMTDDLNKLDNKITKLFDTGKDHDPFRFPVYCLDVGERGNKYFAIQYAKEPLKTLRVMSMLPEIQGVERRAREEIKLLYRTLSKILNYPPDQDFRQTCTLVPISAENVSFQNGELVRCIMHIVQSSSYKTQVDGVLGVEGVNKRVNCQESQLQEGVEESQESQESQLQEGVEESQESQGSQLQEGVEESQESQLQEGVEESQESQLQEGVEESQESQLQEGVNKRFSCQESRGSQLRARGGQQESHLSRESRESIACKRESTRESIVKRVKGVNCKRESTK